MKLAQCAYGSSNPMPHWSATAWDACDMTDRLVYGVQKLALCLRNELSGCL